MILPVVLNDGNEKRNERQLMHAFLQHAKRSNYTTRRSCSGNLARSSRTTFGWSVVSFIFVCCLKDWISRVRMTMVFFRWMEIYICTAIETKRVQNIRSKDDLHRLLDNHVRKKLKISKRKKLILESRIDY